MKKDLELLIEEQFYKTDKVIGAKLLNEIIKEQINLLEQAKDEQAAGEIALILSDIGEEMTDLDISVNESDSTVSDETQQEVTEAKAETSERQERKLIELINTAAKQKKKINLVTSTTVIKNVIGAEKFAGLSALNKEPYTDVIIKTTSGNINISAKGDHAPSIAGGGGVALKKMVPDIFKKFLISAENFLRESGYKAGDSSVPDVYGKIKESKYLEILRGNEEMGGPIDYMYIGPMEVTADLKGFDLILNGKFTAIEEFASSNKIYFRARKRRNDQPFAPGVKDKEGYPILYGKSPTKGDTGRRIVLYTESHVPKKAKIITF
jgi:hypothetical protein